MPSTSTSSEPLRFTLLGPVRVWRGDRELTLGPPQRKAVLATLLLRADQVVTASELVDAVWGESAPASVHGVVQTHVSMLRSVLEPERPRRGQASVLRSVGNGYSLAVGSAGYDLREFEKTLELARQHREEGNARDAVEWYAKALAMWQGEPLSAIPGPGAVIERARLSEIVLGVQEERLELMVALGRHTAAVTELAALTSAHPVRERLRALHMKALSRSGRRADALQVYTDTRRVMVDELGIEPGAELRELHHRLLAVDEPRQQPVAPPPAQPSRRPIVPFMDEPLPAPISPAQLPADVADFTGRTALVKRLTAMLTPRTHRTAPPRALVAGIGGVGKTALAVHAAHQVRQHYPDGQLYVDLRGAGPDAADPLNVLSAFLRAFGVSPNSTPADLDERAAMYRSVLASRRVLVVLDDAADAAQIQHLLPGSATCGVLVTSRRRLPEMQWDEQAELEGMSREEALTLFSRTIGADRAGQEPAAVAEVVDACGRLPLALRITAAKLVDRPQWTVRSMADKLARERGRLSELRVGSLEVEATFHLGYGQLDATSARAFRLMSLPEGPGLSLPAAAALVGEPEPSAEPVVERLVDLNMVASPSPDHYAYHDLLRLFARQRAAQTDSKQDRIDAMVRLGDHYLGTAATAGWLIQAPAWPKERFCRRPYAGGVELDDLKSAFAWFEDQQPALLASARQFLTDPDLPSDYVVDLITFLELYLANGTHFGEIGQIGELAVRDAERTGDLRVEAWGRRKVGEAHLRRFQLPEAQDQLSRSIAAAEKAGDAVALATAMDLLGSVEFRMGDGEQSLAHLEQALAVAHDAGDVVREAYVLGTIGRTQSERGEFELAMAACEKSRELHEQLGNETGLARTLFMMGLVYQRFRRLVESIDPLEESLAVCLGIEQSFGEGHNLVMLSRGYLADGRAEQAAAAASRARELGEAIGDAHMHAMAVAELGKALHALGKHELGDEHLHSAQTLLTELNSPQAAAVSALLNKK
ncbi:AfsR/SARP family transcriptional regulator [Kutzneria kofuensis]|uniref:DNA-binding SARP family transcriptional activator/tetratricopeptide (TPR) repeat protein n=1 Tax=Kutzneria kofuensis TaxID=103725 RepID=A0A7W9KIU8_9PSEU|nr:AfsR/SARP family transcriptional regulator [Kutzneria kofuensis]MBB5893351.1 DNA-binding SARP family transcriptional activator/tetratricopeptide (TPR) repeat protein [Kutzneria kofuensis]